MKLQKTISLYGRFFIIPVFLIIISLIVVKLSYAQACQNSALNDGLISALSLTGGSFGNKDQACVYNTSAAYRNFNVPTYADLESQFYTFSKSPAKKNYAPTSPYTDNGIYLVNSNAIVNGPTGTGVQVIFIRGNLSITGNIDYADSDPNSGLVFIVSGDINIYQNVTNVNAVLISAGKICTAFIPLTTSTGVCSAGTTIMSQLVINGSLISINKTNLPDGESAILLRRTLTANTMPAEKINKQAKYLYILRNGIFTKNLTLIQEDKIYALPSYVPVPSPSLAPSPSPTPDPLASGLVSYWKLDEGTGTVASDISGGNTGTVAGTPAWVSPGKIAGSSLNLNGSTNYISIANGTNLNFPANGQFTISAWVKTSDSYGSILSLRSSTNPNSVIDFNIGSNGCAASAGLLAIAVRDDAGAVVNCSFGSGAINDGQWHQVALTRSSGGSLIIYRDGGNAAVGSAAVSGAITTNQRAIGSERNWVQAGAFTASEQYLSGIVDEIGIWNKALTPSQITQLNNSGAGTNSFLPAPTPTPAATPNPLNTGLLAYWKMENTATPYDSGTNITSSTAGSANTYTTGKIGSALSNPGTSSGIAAVYGSSSGINFQNANNFTLSFWLKTPSIPVTIRLIGSQSLGGWGLEVYPDTRMELISFSGPAGSSAAFVGAVSADNQYHHYVIRYSGNYATLRKDNAINSAASFTPAWSSAGRTLYIGGDASYTLNGQLDEFGIWNRSISDTEVGYLYNGGIGDNSFVPAAVVNPCSATSFLSITSIFTVDSCIFSIL